MTTTTPRTEVLDDPGQPPPPAPAPRHHPARVTAAVLCALLGSALLAGGAATTWSRYRADHRPLPPDAAYRKAASLWHTAPVDGLLPPVVEDREAGPGGSSRTWTRIALAPDADCAVLPADWRAALAAAGCTRVLRATYTDSTRSSLITVGLVFTPAEAKVMDGLRGRLPAPPAYEYADSRRAAWTAGVVAEAPAVVYAVSAFADGRAMDAPVPAEEAARPGGTGTVAEAGLGHEAKALAVRVERALGALAAPPGTEPDAQAAAPRRPRQETP
ncbi:hypothetical protein GCM10010302_33030 [Streptomyces polychromogenes]|uniref:Secreted protein n=1 Tax=Streptomyces polychromogenes TaxID=67342 RepID=A0ABP3F434_9ACTN